MADQILNNQVTTEVTGVENVDAEAAVQKQVAEAIAKYEASQRAKVPQTYTAADLEKFFANRDPAVEVPSGPKPIKVPINGQEYTFNSLEELGQQVSQALSQRQGGQTAQPSTTAQTEPQGYDEAKFTDLLDPAKGGNTVKAMEYVMSHTGLARQNQALTAQVQALKMKETARDVKELVPTFKPKSPQEVAVIDQIRQQLGGAPDNAYAWEAAYAVAVNRGLIKRELPSKEQETAGRSDMTQSAPPFLGRSNATEDPGESELLKKTWGLPTEEVGRLLRAAQERSRVN